MANPYFGVTMRVTNILNLGTKFRCSFVLTRYVQGKPAFVYDAVFEGNSGAFPTVVISDQAEVPGNTQNYYVFFDSQAARTGFNATMTTSILGRIKKFTVICTDFPAQLELLVQGLPSGIPNTTVSGKWYCNPAMAAAS
jgi:hypothetical protein